MNSIAMNSIDPKDIEPGSCFRVISRTDSSSINDVKVLTISPRILAIKLVGSSLIGEDCEGVQRLYPLGILFLID
jgi:hypothetical protein